MSTADIRIPPQKTTGFEWNAPGTQCSVSKDKIYQARAESDIMGEKSWSIWAVQKEEKRKEEKGRMRRNERENNESTCE